ncbi:hypothetical protein E2320_008618, partial [Naja naja]
IPESKLHSGLKNESPEGYYEEAEPYSVSINDDEAVSSSYESYDEEESSKSKSAPHQWPSPEASIELMKDARICAFLWRKKWLGQWAKQLCMIKENRLLDHSPQLDVNLVSCSVIHKEKNLRKQEHKLKIIPMNADVIVLGLQSKDQAEQWLRVSGAFFCFWQCLLLQVIQETSGLYPEGPCEGNQYVPDFQRFNNPKKLKESIWDGKHGTNLVKRNLDEKAILMVVKTSFPLVEPSESGSNTEGHTEMVETKDGYKGQPTHLVYSAVAYVLSNLPYNGSSDSRKGMIISLNREQLNIFRHITKKKCTPGLKFSNLMNLGRKKSTSMDSPERSLDTCTYLNVLVNSQWKSYWCHVKDGQLHFYQDKNRNKAAQPALNLVGCEFIPDPSPDHIYSFRILHKGEELAMLESDPTVVMAAPKEKTEKPKVMNPAPVETKLGKNRTEAEVKRYSEERDHLEKNKEEIRSQLAKLRKEKRELKEMLMNCSDKNKLSTMEQKLKEIEEECKKKEDQRVDLELKLVEAKENLRKAESGPVTLGTTVDTAHMENASPKMKVANPTNNTENSPVNSAVALKTVLYLSWSQGKGQFCRKQRNGKRKVLVRKS